MAKLKVYGWCACLSDDGLRERMGLAQWSNQVRCIIAARSKAEVARLLGTTVARIFNLCETGNATEIAVATEAPHCFFVAPLHTHTRADNYHRVHSATVGGR